MLTVETTTPPLPLSPTPEAPRQHPLEVARDTFVIRAITPSVAGTFTALDPQVVVSAHAPPIGKGAIQRGLAQPASLPGAVPVALEQAGNS